MKASVFGQLSVTFFLENPEILILDEATSGLDLFAREKLLTQIEQITSLPNAPTILYVTHHAEEITQSMTHVLLLKKGEIIAQGPKNEVLTEDILTDFYDRIVSIISLGDERIYNSELISFLQRSRLQEANIIDQASLLNVSLLI